MRILMLHHDPDGALGGASHMAWRTADALAERGHDTALAGTVPPVGHAPPPGQARAAQRLGPDLPRSVGEIASRTGWVPEVVHVTDLVDPTAAARGLALARGAGALFALTPATDASLWKDEPAARELARQAGVVFVLTPSEGLALGSIGVSPVRLAPLGQGPQLVGEPDPSGFRARVGARGPLVLFLGRKLPTKGYQHLIAATPAIVDRHPDATVVVAGPEPPGGSGCGRAPATISALRQLGGLDETEKHSALMAADLLCLPSVADAFPLVFVEAWWCGTPVLSGPFPGAREVVRDGVDGVVTAADAESVAAAVIGLLANPARRRAMARAGRLRAETELSWDAVAAAAERGYREAARLQVSPEATPAATTPL